MRNLSELETRVLKKLRSLADQESLAAAVVDPTQERARKKLKALSFVMHYYYLFSEQDPDLKQLNALNPKLILDIVGNILDPIQSEQENADDMASINEAAELLGLSSRTIWRVIERGQARSEKRLVATAKQEVVFVSLEDLKTYLQGRIGRVGRPYGVKR